MLLFHKPKRAVISEEVYVRARCASPKEQGQEGTVWRERWAPAAAWLEVTSAFPLAQAIALRMYSYCKMVLANPL